MSIAQSDGLRMVRSEKIHTDQMGLKYLVFEFVKCVTGCWIKPSKIQYQTSKPNKWFI